MENNQNETVFATLTDGEKYQAIVKAHDKYNRGATHSDDEKSTYATTGRSYDAKKKKKKVVYHYKKVKNLLLEIQVIGRQCSSEVVAWIEEETHKRFFNEISKILYRRKIQNVYDKLFSYSTIFKYLKDMLGMHNKGSKKRMPPNEKKLYGKILSLEKILFPKK